MMSTGLPWDQVGGSGTITTLGGMLVVTQTDKVHKQIGPFLMQVHEQLGTVRTMQIRAHWLVLDRKQFRAPLDQPRLHRFNINLMQRPAHTQSLRPARGRAAIRKHSRPGR